ncbi:MAG: hypothetical protein PHH14_00135 [Candidatus Margulisbacteria bacterium]|nr:hypothetical protein [Candidatus Margulisiibacteriota bacterium]
MDGIKRTAKQSISSLLFRGLPVIAEGSKPHLAEIVPEIGISRAILIDQIRAEIASGQSLCILGIPGTGKSTIVQNWAKTILGPKNYYVNKKNTWEWEGRLGITAELFDQKLLGGHGRKRIFFDDVFPAAATENMGSIQEIINNGGQVIFSYPNFVEGYARNLADELGGRLYVLPPADYNEFVDTMREPDFIRKHSQAAELLKKYGQTQFSEETLKIFYELCGGNYALILDVLFTLSLTSDRNKGWLKHLREYEKKYYLGQLKRVEETIMAGEGGDQKTTGVIKESSKIYRDAYNIYEDEPQAYPPQEQIKILFEPTFHSIKGTLLAHHDCKMTDFLSALIQGLPSADFWGFHEEIQEKIVSWLKYGLLTLSDNKIMFRGQLIEYEYYLEQ